MKQDNAEGELRGREVEAFYRALRGLEFVYDLFGRSAAGALRGLLEMVRLAADEKSIPRSWMRETDELRERIRRLNEQVGK